MVEYWQSTGIGYVVIIWIMERKRRSGFRSIFTVAYLIIIGPAWGSNQFPNLKGQSSTFT